MSLGTHNEAHLSEDIAPTSAIQLQSGWRVMPPLIDQTGKNSLTGDEHPAGDRE
jgi:hypothetical protein